MKKITFKNNQEAVSTVIDLQMRGIPYEVDSHDNLTIIIR